MRANFWQGHAPNQALVAISRLSPESSPRCQSDADFLAQTPLFLNSQTSRTVRYTSSDAILFHAKNGLSHNAKFYFIVSHDTRYIFEIPPDSPTRLRRPQPPCSLSKRKTRQITSHSGYVRHTLMFAPLQRAGWAGGRPRPLGVECGPSNEISHPDDNEGSIQGESLSQCGLRDEAGPRRWTWSKRSGSPR